MSLEIYPIPGVYKTNESFDVSVIIPLYKSNEVVEEQILRWTQDADIKTEIIYVDDNCPTKSSQAVFKAWNKRRDKNNFSVRLILSGVNQGFGRTCNLGAYKAKGKYLVFLNADTVVTPNWLYPILDVFRKDEKVGIVGNLQIKDGGEFHNTVDSAGSSWSWEHMNFIHLGRHILNDELLEKPLKPNELPDELMEVSEREMVTACCLAMPKDLFDKIGGFDINYQIAYWEDSELNMRVKELGYKIVFQPNSVIYHKLSHSGGAAHKYVDVNKNYFLNKWVYSGRINDLVKENPYPVNHNISNILVKRRAANGDVLIAAAIAPALKKKYPNAVIHFVTDCPQVLAANPHIDHVLKYRDIEKFVFQLVINLDYSYELRPHDNILQCYADTAGVNIEDCDLYFRTDPVENLPETYVVIHPGQTAWAGRNWDVEKFCEISNRLSLIKNIKVICVGNGSDAGIPCDLDYRELLSLWQLAYVIKKSKLFIGIDSLPMHIAQAVKARGVAFFGCIKPETRLLSNRIKPVVAQDLPCLGCHHRKFAPAVSLTICENGTEDCIKKVSVEDYWKAINEMLALKG